MNFGAILDEWERMVKEKPSAQGVQKKAEQVKPQKKQEKKETESVDPLTTWLRINGVHDKDAEDLDAESARARRRRLLQKRPDAMIDLHGLTQAEAWTALESFFADCRRQGFEKLSIIHGKGNHSAGNGVLKETVRSFIERCPFAGESGHGSATSGGTGATWVLLRSPH
jgi:DNA-nicking Smr family endonuclease